MSHAWRQRKKQKRNFVTFIRTTFPSAVDRRETTIDGGKEKRLLSNLGKTFIDSVD